MVRDVYIYPNPVRHSLRVSLSGFDRGPVELTILNDSGKQLLKDLVQVEEGPMDLDFPEVGHFESGVYLLALQDADRLATRQFIKL